MPECKGDFYLTTAEVARRLGMSSSTVRRWAEVLAEYGYLSKAETGEYRWTAEVVELVEFLEGVMQAAPGKIPIRRAIELMEEVGRKALEARRGRTYAAAVFEAARAASWAAKETAEAREVFERAAREELQALREEVLAVVRTSGFSEVRRELEEAARAVEGGRLALNWAEERLRRVAGRLDRLVHRISFGPVARAFAWSFLVLAGLYVVLLQVPDLWAWAVVVAGDDAPLSERVRVFLQRAFYWFLPPAVLGASIAVLLAGGGDGGRED